MFLIYCTIKIFLSWRENVLQNNFFKKILFKSLLLKNIKFNSTFSFYFFVIYLPFLSKNCFYTISFLNEHKRTIKHSIWLGYISHLLKSCDSFTVCEEPYFGSHVIFSLQILTYILTLLAADHSLLECKDYQQITTLIWKANCFWCKTLTFSTK